MQHWKTVLYVKKVYHPQNLQQKPEMGTLKVLSFFSELKWDNTDVFKKKKKSLKWKENSQSLALESDYKVLS